MKYVCEPVKKDKTNMLMVWFNFHTAIYGTRSFPSEGEKQRVQPCHSKT